jgi:hypothetical protein
MLTDLVINQLVVPIAGIDLPFHNQIKQHTHHGV